MHLCCNTCISDNEEGGTDAEDDDDDDDADANADAVTDTATDNAAPDNDNYATMPPKLKPPPRKPAGTKKTKGESAAAAATPPPAPKPPENFSVNSTEKFLVSYHTKGTQDITDVVFHINGVLRDTDYHVSVAADRKSVSWQRAIQSVCFTKKICRPS